MTGKAVGCRLEAGATNEAVGCRLEAGARNKNSRNTPTRSGITSPLAGEVAHSAGEGLQS
jgi:hypothetical protein